MPKVYLKSYVTEKGTMIAMCDSELIGKTFKEGKVELDLDKYADFYKGQLLEVADAERNIKEEASIYSANVVGKRSVNILIKNGIVAKEDVKQVESVPFVHLYNVL